MNKDIEFLWDFVHLCFNILTRRPHQIQQHIPIANWIKQFKQLFKENSLAIIIAMHAYRLDVSNIPKQNLGSIFNSATNQPKSVQYEKYIPTESLHYFLIFATNELTEKTSLIKNRISQNERKTIITILQNILNLIQSSQFLIVKWGRVYQTYFTAFNKSLPNEQQPKDSSLHSYLLELNRIEELGETSERRKKLNKFIVEQLLAERPEGALMEVAFNWLKREAEVMQREKEELVCCRLIFEHKSTSVLGKFSESANQEFKDYRWPLENESIKQHLTKTVVGFLNTTGGIIYVGLREDKSKIIEVKGIKLSPQQKIDFLFFLHNDILKGVYPKEPDRYEFQEDQKDHTKAEEVEDYMRKLREEFESTRPKNSEYRLNKYVYVDFLDIYDKNTLVSSRDDGCGLYIARIKIKIGDTRELYHIINQEKRVPEAYFREQKSVKKKNMKEFYQEFYKRMKNTSSFDNAAKVEQHAYCRFNPRCTEDYPN